MTHTEDTKPEKLHFGTRLRTARESRQLSISDIGSRLRLNPDIIHDLEMGNYHKGPPAIFIRGYIRSYARLMDFAEIDILTALTDAGLAIDPGAPLVPNLKKTPTDPSPMISRLHWISLGVVLTLAFLVFMWWNAYPVTWVRGLFPATISSSAVQSLPSQAGESKTNGGFRAAETMGDAPEAQLILPNNFGVMPDMSDTPAEPRNTDPS